MKSNDLGFIERISIALRCRRDIRKHRFQEYEYKIDKLMDKSIFISPFITTELACLINRRSKKLNKGIVSLNVSKTKSIFGKRIFTVPHAICKIDELITETERRISASQEGSASRINTLREMRYRFNEHKAYHHAQVCIDKITSIRAKELNNVHKLQKHLLAYVNEKMKLISTVNAKINAFQAHQFMRIQYYYGYASTHSEDLPVLMFNQEDFEVIAGEKLGNEHTGILEAAQQKISELTKTSENKGRYGFEAVADKKPRTEHTENPKATQQKSAEPDFMKIQYNYGYANTHSEDLPVLKANQEDFEVIANEKPGNNHAGNPKAVRQEDSKPIGASLNGNRGGMDEPA